VEITLHALLPGGIIYLDSSDCSIGSDVEEIIKWDDCLRKTKPFSTAYLILVGRKYGSPLLDEQQTLLLNFVDQPAEDYCRQNSSQAKAFGEIMTICKAGWKTETSRKKKWTACFVAEYLALLLVIRRQVEKEKETRRAEEVNQAATRSGSASRTGVPKATKLMRAIRKLWAAYEPSLKLHVQAQKDAESVVHRTPSLSLQLNGTCDQDHVPWRKWAKCESNCQLQANVSASGGKEEHNSSGGSDGSGGIDGHNGRKGPKEGTGRILERVFAGDKEDCGKGACTARTQRSCLHVCR
jgi:hypothetical protein